MKSGKTEGLQYDLEKSLIQSNQLLQYIIANDFTAIAVLDHDLKHIYLSRKFLTDWSVEEEDILGKHHYEIFPDLPDSWKEAHKRTLAGETLSSDEDQFRRSDGTIIWVRWECKPWYAHEGEIGGIILYTEVITKKKEIQLELIKAKEKAEESDRLKTAFLQNISHEVRTPLNSIVGFSELMAMQGQSSEKAKAYSKIISDNSHKLLNILTDVIDLSQIQSGEINIVRFKFELLPLLDKIAETFRETIQMNEIKFIVQHSGLNPGQVFISDKVKIEKIIFHLLDNAVKFTKRGSIKFLSKVKDDNLSLTVSDTGIGIRPQDQERIFEPFLQLETGADRKNGTGIGLAVVKAYTKALGGTISLASIKNKGTTVTVTIPVQPETSRPVIDSELNAGKDVNTILIAEDEFSNYRYLHDVLHSDTVQIVHARNGSEAVDICTRTEDIDLILMDLRMPVLDGISAARQIRRIRPKVPIIAQTAYREKSDPVFDDFILKPINRNDLNMKIRKYLVL